METITNIENSFITTAEGKYASREQIQMLYKVPKATLADNINVLKKDGLINGMEIRSVVGDGKKRTMEVFNMDEVISIGFRLRSEMAFLIQKYAAGLVKEKITEMKDKIRSLEFENSLLWNKSDIKDLYGS